MTHMNTDIYISFLEPLSRLTGITDQWVFICVFLALIVIILLIILISSAGKKRALRRQVAELEETMTGLQALVNLPPVREDIDFQGGGSIVFESEREKKRKARAARDADDLAADAAALSATQSIPSIPEIGNSAEQAATSNVTQAVHNAIYASVTGTHKPVDPEPQKKQDPADTSLSGRIPHI